MKRLALLSALILAPLSASAVEYPIEIVNGDFELAGIIPPIPPGSFEFAEFDVPPGSPVGYSVQLPLTVPGPAGAVSFGWELLVSWTDAEALTDVLDFAVPILSPASGVQYDAGEYDGHVGGIYIADDAGVSDAMLRQTTAHNLLPDTRYRMSVDIGNIKTSNPFLNFGGFPGYRVTIAAGNVEKLASDTNSVFIGNGKFETVVLTFDTPSAAELSSTNLLGQPVVIYLMIGNDPHEPDGPGIPANEVNFDNITLTYEPLEDIPEEKAEEDDSSPQVGKPVKTRGGYRSDFKSIR